MVDLNFEQLQNLATATGISIEVLKQILPSITQDQKFAQIDLKQWFLLKRALAQPVLPRWCQHDIEVVKPWNHPQAAQVLAILKDPSQAVEGLDDAYRCLLSAHPDILTKMRTELEHQAELILHLPKQATPAQLGLQQDWLQAKTSIKMLDANLLFRFFRAKSAQVRLEFRHPQGEVWAMNFLSQYFAWSHQGRVADDWIQASLEKLITTIILPMLHRDLLALLYDKMVAAYLDLLILKLEQIVKFPGIGEKSCLLLYPHGRAGVMALVMDAKGQEVDHLVFYPHSPDYDVEASLADLAKFMIKHHLSDLGLVQKPETKKALHKLLSRLKERYADLSWQLHVIPGEFTKLLPMKAVKHPCVEDVLQIAGFLQHPQTVWPHLNLNHYLDDLAAVLPASVYENLWQLLIKSDAQHAAMQPHTHFEVDKTALAEIKPGTLFIATVGTIVNYGVFLEIAPGVEGLLHVSAMGRIRPSDMSTCFKTGDSLVVTWQHYDATTKRIGFGLVKKPEQSKIRKVSTVKKSVEKPIVKPQISGAMQMAFAKLKQQN